MITPSMVGDAGSDLNLIPDVMVVVGSRRKRGAAVLQCPRSYSAIGTVHEMASARVVEALGTPAAGLCPRPAREKRFPSNLFLD